jgi:hypothetical protein
MPKFQPPPGGPLPSFKLIGGAGLRRYALTAGSFELYGTAESVVSLSGGWDSYFTINAGGLRLFKHEDSIPVGGAGSHLHFYSHAPDYQGVTEPGAFAGRIHFEARHANGWDSFVHIYGIVVDPAMRDGYVNFEGSGSTRSVSIYPNANQIIFGDQDSPLGGPSIGAVGLLSDGVSFGLEASSGNDLVLKVDDNANFTFDLIDSGTGNRALSYTEGQLHIRNRRQGEGYFNNGNLLTTLRISPYLSPNIVTGGGALGSGPRVRFDTLDMRGTPLAPSGESFTAASIGGYTKENKPLGPAKNWVDLSGVALGDYLEINSPTATTTFTAVDTLVNPTDFLIGGTDDETAINLASAITSALSGALTAAPIATRIEIVHDVVGAFGNAWTVSGATSFSFPIRAQFWGGSDGREGYLCLGVASNDDDGTFNPAIRIEPNGAIGFLGPGMGYGPLAPANVLLELDPDGPDQLLLRTPEGTTPGLRFVPSARGEVNGTSDGTTLGILSYGSLQNGGQGQISGVVTIAGRLVSNDNHVGELVLEVDSGWGGGGTRFIIDGYSTLWFDNERTASIGAETSKLKFGLGEYEPALELLQSTHVYTGNRYTRLDYLAPTNAGVTPTYGLFFFISDWPNQPPQYFPIRSADGENWAKEAAIGFTPCEGVAANGDTLFVIGYADDLTFNVYRSDNGGTTWSRVLGSELPRTSVYGYPRCPKVLADGTWVFIYNPEVGGGPGLGRIRYSFDEGVSWSEMPVPMPWPSRTPDVDRIGSRWVLPQTESGTGNVSVLYSDDDGANWESATVPPCPPPWSSAQVFILQNSGDLFLLVERWGDNIHELLTLRSIDSGSSWVQEGTPLSGGGLVYAPTPFFSSAGYLCFAAEHYTPSQVSGYVVVSTSPVSAGPLQLRMVPIRVDPVNTTGPVGEIHETLEFNGRIYGIGHTPWNPTALAAVVWSDDLTGANWLNLSDPITKLAPQGGYLDLGAQYLELTEPLTGAKYLSVEMGEATNAVLTAVGKLQFGLCGNTTSGWLAASTVVGQGYSFELSTNSYGANLLDLRTARELRSGLAYQGQIRMFLEEGVSPALKVSRSPNSFVTAAQELHNFTSDEGIVIIDNVFYSLLCLENGSGRLVSSTDGRTWTPLGSITEFPVDNQLTSLFVEDGVIGVLGSSMDIFLTPDLGVTWEVRPISGLTTKKAFTYSPSQRIIIVAGDANLVYSQDLGLSWTELTPFPGLSIEDVFISGTRWFATTAQWGSGCILWLSDDSGATWQQTSLSYGENYSSYAQWFEYNNVLIHIINLTSPDIILQVWRSTNRGQDWTLATSIPNWNVINQPQSIICGDRGLVPIQHGNVNAILVSDVALDDPALTFCVMQSLPLLSGRIVEVHSLAAIGDLVVSIGHRNADPRDAVAVWSTNGGRTWGYIPTKIASEYGLDLGAEHVEFTAQNSSKYLSIDMDAGTNTVITAVGDIHLQLPNTSIKIAEGGQTHLHDRIEWISGTDEQSIRCEWVVAWQTYTSTYGVVFGYSDAGTYFSSAYFGNSYSYLELISTAQPIGVVTMGRAGTPGNPTRVGIALANGDFLYSTNLASWAVVNTSPQPFAIGTNLFFADTGWLLAPQDPNSGPGILLSENFGVDWTSITTPFIPKYVVSRGGIIHIFADDSVSCSEDMGATWTTVAAFSDHVDVLGTLRLGVVVADDYDYSPIVLISDVVSDSEQYGYALTYDLGVFVSRKRIPLPASVGSGVLIPASNGGGVRLVPCPSNSYQSRAYVIDVGVGTTPCSVIPAVLEQSNFELRGLLFAPNSTWVGVGYEYLSDRGIYRSGVIRSSDGDGRVWGDFLSAASLVPEAGVLELVTDKLSICEPIPTDPFDALLVDLTFTKGIMKVHGDLEVTNGAILTSPNGTLYRISVDNDGVLTSTPV